MTAPHSTSPVLSPSRRNFLARSLGNVTTAMMGIGLSDLLASDGEPLPGEENFLSFQGKNGNLMQSPWPFVPAGESGKKISSMLPHLQQHVDRIAFVHSLSSKSNTHGPGCIFMNTGHVAEGFPAAGSWLS